MKNPITTISIILIVLCFVLISFCAVEARSGCCSSHGGVCGCHCCDGTSLSATCAPHYPSCSSPKPPRIYCGDGSCNGSETCSSCSSDCGACKLPAKQPINSNETNVSNESPKILANVNTGEQSSDSWAWWVLGILGVGVVAYNVGKKKVVK